MRGALIRVDKKTYDNSKRVSFIKVVVSKRRVIALTKGEHIHVCWISMVGRDMYCSCPSFQYRIEPCKHIVATAKLFTGAEVKVE